MAIIFVIATNMIPIVIVVRPATNSAATVAHTAETREPATLCDRLHCSASKRQLGDVCLRFVLVKCYLCENVTLDN